MLKRSLNTGIFVIVGITVLFMQESMGQVLPHPSIVNTRAQLDAMKYMVNNKPGSIARNGWDWMLKSELSNINWTHHPYAKVDFVPSGSSPSEDAFRKDPQAARSLALQWVVTGNSAYRTKALKIINDWVRTLTGWWNDTDQASLETAWILPIFLSAADILRYYDTTLTDWSSSDIAAFNTFAAKLHTQAAKARLAHATPSNWHVASWQSSISYYAYMGNSDLLKSTIAGAISSMDVMSKTTGEITETCRDNAHPQYSLSLWESMAATALNCGYPDIWETKMDGQTTPRLAIILEYFAKMMMGVTDDPCGNWSDSYVGKYNVSDSYDYGYNYYLFRKKVNYLPTFKKMVEDKWRYDRGTKTLMFLWSSLTDGENDGTVSTASLQNDRPVTIIRRAYVSSGGILHLEKIHNSGTISLNRLDGKRIWHSSSLAGTQSFELPGNIAFQGTCLLSISQSNGLLYRQRIFIP